MKEEKKEGKTTEKVLAMIFMAAMVMMVFAGVVNAKSSTGNFTITATSTINIDQIMSDAKLIEKVQTNSTVNLSAIIDDSDFDATLQGDYAVWEEELDDYIYKYEGYLYHGVAGYTKSPVIIKIAVSNDGTFYLGIFNGTTNGNLLIFSQPYSGIANYYDFSGDFLDQSQYGEPHDHYLDLDARQNHLAFIFAEVYKDLYNKGHIKSGPTDYYELYNCNYSKENRFNRPITVIRSFIFHQQFSGYPEKRRLIGEARNAKWSPIASNPDQDAYLSRSFDVKYQNVSDSFVWILAYSDNSMHSDTTIYGMDNPPDYSCSGGSGSRTWRVTYDSDAKTYNVHNDNCADAQLFLNDQLPNKVLIELYTTWSGSDPQITIAVLGDITTSNHSESPSPGDDNNPEPLVWVIEPAIASTKPMVTTTTDKTTYTTGDIMDVEIKISNPSSVSKPVVFGWWLTIPSFDYMTVPIATIPMTLPAGYDEIFTFPINVGYWCEESFCAVWCVALSDPDTNEIISFDSTYWNYMPTEAAKVKKSPVSIEREIRKEIEKVGLPG